MTRMRWISAAAIAAALATAAPAAASVGVTGVDASSFPTIHVTVVSSSGAAVAPQLTENGRPVSSCYAFRVRFRLRAE